jgi:hypothetical protein
MTTTGQLVLEGFPLPLPVRGRISDRGAELLDELDTCITLLDGLLSEQEAARLVIVDAETEQAVIDASLTLTTEGRNEQERRARLTLALRADPTYQQLAAAVREARAVTFGTERRVTVLRARMTLIRAVLALLSDEEEQPR